MSKYFDENINRHGTHSVKWDMNEAIFGKADVLPMWVADMDFASPQPVIEALHQLVDSRILGYSFAPDSLYDTIINWQTERHHLLLKKEDILFSPGVVPSIAACIQALTQKGEAVMIQDPVYHPFADMVDMNERQLIRSALKIEEDQYKMDFADIEKQIIDQQVKLFILCNPHNPGGRVWSADELTTLLNICQKHHVKVISDEIHNDLVYQPNQFHSAVTLKESYASFVITLAAPTKTFNLAGIKNSMLFILDTDLREKIKLQQAKAEMSNINTFGYAATEAAFSKGSMWLDELMLYLTDNLDIICTFFDKELPDVFYMRPQATYLLWFDCSSLGLEDDALMEAFVTEGKIGLNAGISYGQQGAQFMRFNFAAPRETVLEGLKRIKHVFDLHQGHPLS